VGVLALGLPLGLIATSANAATLRHAPGTRAASVRTADPAAACSGPSCWGQDPSAWATNCVGYALSFKQLSITAFGNLLATGDNVYSYGCNANWTQGTLTPYAISQGYTLSVQTQTADSQNPQYGECTSFPGGDLEYLYSNVKALLPCVDAPPGYDGATGWPAYTDMVDGTNTTLSVMKVYDPQGHLVAFDAEGQ